MQQSSAVPKDHLVETQIVAPGDARITRAKTQCLDYAQKFLLGGQGNPHALGGALRGVLGVDHQASIGAGQTVQGEGILMFFEKPPYLGLFPAPAMAQCFQRQNGAQGAKLHCGRHV